MSDGDVVLLWVHHHALLLQLVTLCLEEVLAPLVEIGHPDLEWGRPILLPECEGGPVWIGSVPEALRHVLVESRQVSQVDFLQSSLLGRRKEGGVDLQLG